MLPIKYYEMCVYVYNHRQKNKTQEEGGKKKEKRGKR